MGMADWSWRLVDRVKYKTKHKGHWCLFPTGGGEAWARLCEEGKFRGRTGGTVG